jgi:hypothetical protein
MYIPFSQISPDSRVWIYQADRRLATHEVELAKQSLSVYCGQWKAHGAELKASFDIRFEYFIIIAADEDYNATSGCSIDDSVRAVKQLETLLNVNFFNRNLVAFKNGSEIQLIDRARLKEKYNDGMWNGTTQTFNNLVDIKSKLDEEWIVDAGKTWLRRFIPAANIFS